MYTQAHTAKMWTLRTAEAVGPLAAAAGAGWLLVAAGGRTVHIVDETGKVQGRFKAGQPVRQLHASRDATVLTALAGDAIIYAFNVRGQLEWRVELGGAVAAFAMAQSGANLAAVSAGGWLYTYSPATRERRLAPVGWPMASVAVADAGELRVIVAGEKGRIALLNAEGKPQWQKDLDCQIGPICTDASGGRIFVPARERGLLIFDADGKEAGTLRLGGDVLRAEVGPEGLPAMVELSGARLLLVGEDSAILWERQPDPTPLGWAFGVAGTRLVVTEGERTVVAYQVEVTDGPPSEPATAAPVPTGGIRAPEMPEPVEVDLPEYLEIEEAMAEDASPEPPPPKPKKERHLKWKKRLPAEMLPVRPGFLRLSSDGAFVVFVLTDGTIAALDRRGTPAAKCVVAGAAEIVPQPFAGTVGVRAGTYLYVLDLQRRSVREVTLGEGEPAAFGCSGDLSVLYVLDREGRLCAFGRDGAPSWRKSLGSEVQSLLVSPDGGTVLVCDAGHRFRYYDAQGDLQRKFRFGEAEGHRAGALGNDFSAFVGPGGRLTVLDSEGHRVWERTVFQAVTRVERLDGALGVYGEGGVCAAIEPSRDRVWEFVPAPGQALLRKPAGGDPVLVHAAGADVTVFTGYRRKLDVLWRCSCTGPVEQFDADRDARCVVVLADGKLHRLEAERS